MKTVLSYVLLLNIIINIGQAAISKPISLSCSKNGLSVFYINGIGYDQVASEDQAFQTLETVKTIRGLLDNKEVLHEEGLIRNLMGLTYWKDLFKLIRQKAEELGYEDSWKEKLAQYIFTSKAF